MHTNITKPATALFFAMLLFSSCNKPPFQITWETLFGAVIGKENCKGSNELDYWLIDLSVYAYNSPQYGDTVTYQGKFYEKAVKLKGLDKSLQVPGTKVAIETKVISQDKVISTGCTVSNPTIYPLREVTILTQGGASF